MGPDLGPLEANWQKKGWLQLASPLGRHSWRPLGAILAPCGALLGPSWRHLGARLGPIGPNMSHLGATLGPPLPIGREKLGRQKT